MIKFLRKNFNLILLISIVFLLGGCSFPLGESTPTQVTEPTVTRSPTPTKTQTPTLTPLPPVGVLLAPAGSATELSAEMQSLLADWIPDLGYRFQVRPSLSQSDFIRDDIRLVVILPPYPEAENLVQDHPETRFLTYDIQGLSPASNLSTVGGEDVRLDQQGFIAGYMAAMITEDWRVGVIGSSNSEQAIAARQAFMTGAAFFCGDCLPSYPPWFEYPLYFELGEGADTIAWRTAADFMIHREVGTVYVVPGSGDASMLRHLASAGVNIISGNPYLPDIESRWVASLRYNMMETFVAFWPELIEKANSHPVSAPLQITDINNELFSVGRQRLVNEMLADLLGGYIDMGLDAPIDP